MSGGSASPKGPNLDIPFALSGNGRNGDHVGRHHSNTHTATSKNDLPPAARASPNQLPGNGPAHGSASSLQSSQADPLPVLTAQARPNERLQDLLSSKAAPVVVPRQNDGRYHGVGGQGLDRAINYINYGRPRAGSGYLEGDQQYPDGEINDQLANSGGSDYKHDPNLPLGYASFDSAQQSMSYRSQRQGAGSGREEVFIGGSTGTVGLYPAPPHQESVQGSAFGSLVVGVPCLEPTSLNQAQV